MQATQTVKPLDYFYASWGYDQTNIDYLMVQSVSPTGKTTICRMVKPLNLGAAGTADALTPSSCYGEPFRMHIRYYDNSVSLVGSYPYCQGDKKQGYFHPCRLGDIHYQTNPLFGH